MSAVAEALLKAHKQRASGWMTLTWSGRESKLLLKEGDLVGAQMGFGHQSLLQGLLQAKKLSLTQLDALWARGDAGKADAEALEEVGAAPAESASQLVLAQVRRLATLAANVQFEAGDVSEGDATVSGVEAVRAAFESVARAEAEPRVFRCPDVRECGEWLLTADERALLESLGELKNPGKLPLGQRVLLELLEREGKVESVPEAEWLARLAEDERRRAEEEARLAEARRQAEEEARVAEEQRKAEEAARIAEEKRRALEEARIAEERRLAEEEARLAEERRQAEEAERLARARRLAEEEERLAEERRVAEEQARVAEEERRAQEEARLAEEARVAEEKRRADEEQRRAEEEARLAEEALKAEEKRRAEEEARLAEDARLAEEKRREEEKAAHEARLAEEKRLEEEKAAEEARLADEKRLEEEKAAEEARLAEEKRLEEERAAEEARLAEEKRLEEEKAAEEARLADEKRREEERAAEEARLAEEKRLEEERTAEEARLAEERDARRAEQARRIEAEEARLAEEQRLADEALAREKKHIADDARAATEARLAQEKRFAEEMRRAKDARAAEEAARDAERLAEERRLAEEEEKKAQEKRKAEEAAHLAEQQRREEEERFAEQERLAAERIKREDEERRANEARLAEERAAEEQRREEERAANEKREKEEAEARLAEQRRKYEEEQAAAADAAREMSPDGWFSPSAAPAMPTEPRKFSQPAEPDVVTVPEAEPPTLEAEVIDAEVEPLEAPLVEAQAPRGPVPMDQALPVASETDRLNLAKHRAQADLLRELNEALRRSAHTGENKAYVPPAAEAPPPVPSPPARPSAPPAPMKQPLILGPQGEGAEGGGDLWNLVKPTPAGGKPPGGVASFEEALKRVDASLEQLVDAPRSSGSEPPVEGTVEAEVVVEPASDMGGMEGDLSDPSDPNAAAKERRQRLLRRAMENLGAMQPGRGSNTAKTDPELPVVNVAPKEEPKSSSSAPKPTADDLQLKAQLEARWDDLQKKRELYGILGVPLGGGKDQVKAAFLTLAKVFHPDRLPPSLVDLAPKMQTVFESIREAYETLYDDARRATYMSNLASGTAAKKASTGPGGGQEAAEALRLGEVFFKKRDYKQAEEQFAKAYGIDKSGMSLAAQAWAIYMDPSRKAEAQNAKGLMAKALQIDPNCDRAHYQLGVIARVEGDMDRAERHFREAVRANPRHLEANQELRLIEMRKKKQAPKGGGFFSR